MLVSEKFIHHVAYLLQHRAHSQKRSVWVKKLPVKIVEAYILLNDRQTNEAMHDGKKEKPMDLNLLAKSFCTQNAKLSFWNVIFIFLFPLWDNDVHIQFFLSHSFLFFWNNNITFTFCFVLFRFVFSVCFFMCVYILTYQRWAELKWKDNATFGIICYVMPKLHFRFFDNCHNTLVWNICLVCISFNWQQDFALCVPYSLCFAVSGKNSAIIRFYII